MLSFIILLFVMMGIWGILIGLADVSEVSKNWEKYRCKPTIIPLASFFGHDTSENFSFCMKGIMNNEAGFLLAPVFQILGTFLGTISTLMKMANSMRVEIATMMGGINTIFQNFMDRFKQLSFHMQTVAVRMRFLITRLYGTFFALIYMSISGTKALQNFGNTALFQFFDTFCFDPDTPVDIQGRGTLPVKDVNMGDRFTKTGARVTATFAFEADGQAMVELPGPIYVSTNHYIEYKGKNVRADEHPDAKPMDNWNGGKERPLICFNTSDHHIPIGNYLFLDYDETEEGDESTMSWIESRLNASPIRKESHSYLYTTAFAPSTEILMKNGAIKSVHDIDLSDECSHGKVMGIVYKEVTEVCVLPTGEQVAPGLLFWDTETQKWVRAGDKYPIEKSPIPVTFISLIISKSATVETASGLMMRDYVEIHSPDAEQFYAQALTASA